MAGVLIVSDVHLTPGDPDGVARFVRFVEGPAAAAARLVVAGDLFEFWVTPEQAREAETARVLAALGRLAASGVSVGFVEGNRDFAASPELRAAGVATLPDVTVVAEGGLRVAVTHGDLLCRRDVRYQAFRRIVRTPLVRHLLRAAPASLARRSGSAARAGSRAEMARKSEGDLGLDPRAVAELLRAEDADALVCGHVHWGRRHAIDVDGVARDVVVLGAWDAGDATFARVEDGRLTFERFEGAGSRNPFPQVPGGASVDRPGAAPGGHSGPPTMTTSSPARRLTIAIDGPAGAGKSTCARALAARLGYRFLDTGAVYRAVTLAAQRAGIDAADGARIAALAGTARIVLEGEGPLGRVHLGDEDVSAEIRSDAVTRAVPEVSAHEPVRTAVIPFQRNYAAGGGVVAEGRDMGSVVFPDADLKFYLDADESVRAARRAAERGERDVAKVQVEIGARDKSDTERKTAPLVCPPDAERIDTTHMHLDAVVDLLFARVQARAGATRS